MKKKFCLFVSAIILFAMSSCGERKSIEMLAGEWNVISVGEMQIPDSVDAFIGFDVAKYLVYGSTGCNRLVAELPTKVNAGIPLFSTIGSSHKMCADMSVEKALLPAMEEVVDFIIDDNKLYLLDTIGDTVVWLERRQDAL